MQAESGLFLVAVGVIVVRQGRVLALRRAPHKPGAGIWESVSGRVAHGEALEDAAHRELREETGLTARRLVGPVDAYVMDRAGTPMCLVVYRADVEGKAQRSSEHDALAWWSVDECRASMPPRLGAAVAKALASGAGARFGLFRQDDNGNRVEMARFATQREAEHERDVFEARGHKQLYWVEPLD